MSFFKSLFSRSGAQRYDLLNRLIATRGYRRYLEIGTRRGDCFSKVEGVATMTGVDPAPITVEPGWDVRRLTSDAFFEQNAAASPPERFDIVFIDGLHLAEQVLRDIYNSLAVLEPGGTIVLHDCFPASAEAGSRDMSRLEQRLPWNGDVWKALAWVKAHEPELFVATVDTDHGLGVIRRRGELTPVLDEEKRARAEADFEAMSYQTLAADPVATIGLVADFSALDRLLAATP